MPDRERIVTHYDPKPIPVRIFDWLAVFDNYEPGAPISFGYTERDAVKDFVGSSGGMNVTEQLLIPTVHLKGTSKDELIRQLAEAINAVHEAGRKLAAACPNCRDDYVKGPGAIQLAMRQHEDRMKRLKSVATELKTIMEKVDEQGRAFGR